MEHDVARTRPGGDAGRVDGGGRHGLQSLRAVREVVGHDLVEREVHDEQELPVGRHYGAVGVRGVLPRLVGTVADVLHLEARIHRARHARERRVDRTVLADVRESRRAAGVLGVDERLLVGRERDVARNRPARADLVDELELVVLHGERGDAAVASGRAERGPSEHGVEARAVAVEHHERGAFERVQRAERTELARLRVRLVDAHAVHVVRVRVAADVGDVLHVSSPSAKTEFTVYHVSRAVSAIRREMGTKDKGLKTEASFFAILSAVKPDWS